MEYYYAIDNKKQGPVTEEKFKELIRSKKINANTLIWRQGMTEWKMLGEVAGKTTNDVSSSLQSAIATDGSACSECGKSYSEDHLIQFKDRWICSNCKPIYLQKMKEGAALNKTMDHAGFWLRFGAFMIDMIILWFVSMIIYIPFFFVMFSTQSGPEENPALFWIVYFVVMFLGFAVQVFYETWFIGKYAATPGKMACRIKVVVATGDKVSYLRALGRFFAKWISYMTLYIGFIIAGFDREKRALHDMICETRVIRS